MALEVINAQEARQPVPGPQCATCQQGMRHKGRKEVTVESWVGDLRIERGYYLPLFFMSTKTVAQATSTTTMTMGGAMAR